MEKSLGTPEAQRGDQKQDPQSNMALRTFIRENYDVKMYFANTFTCMPSHKTPPSSVRNTRPFNPFNQNLKERLANATFSPTVFESVLSPREVSKTELRWTIEDISKCNPANIDEESHIDGIDSEETREDVQEAIDKYFSQTNMPSPWNVVPKDFSSPMTSTPGSSARNAALKKDHMTSSTPKRSGSEPRIKFVTNVCTQTTWSLPPKLPDHIEEMLKPYLNIVKDDDTDIPDEDDSSILSISNLRRKLDFTRNHLSPQRFDADDSMGSNTSLDEVDRYLGTPLPMVSSPDVSPIHNSKIRKSDTSGSTSSRLNFTQDMNVCTLSEECNDESAIAGKSATDSLEMSLMVCSSSSKLVENNDEFLCPLPITATLELQSQDTGYHTDVTCSQSNNSEELLLKGNGYQTDITGSCSRSDNGCHTNVTGYQTDVTGYQTDVTGYQTDVTGYQTDVTGYQTDVTGYQTDITGHCSQGNNSGELLSKENNDVTYGWSGFTHHLEKAQMDKRHATAVSTPTKSNKHNH